MDIVEKNKIRKRQSYKDFDRIYSEIMDCHGASDILYIFHREFDLKSSYGSETNSAKALESIGILLEDLEEKGELF